MPKAKKNKWAGHVKNKYEVFLFLRMSNKERRRNTNGTQAVVACTYTCPKADDATLKGSSTRVYESMINQHIGIASF